MPLTQVPAALESNLDVEAAVREHLEGSEWLVFPGIPNQRPQQNAVALITTRVHHMLVIMEGGWERADEPLYIYSDRYAILSSTSNPTLPERHIAVLRNIGFTVDVSPRGTTSQGVDATACGPMCVAYARQLRNMIRIPIRWPRLENRNWHIEQGRRAIHAHWQIRVRAVGPREVLIQEMEMEEAIIQQAEESTEGRVAGASTASQESSSDAETEQQQQQ